MADDTVWFEFIESKVFSKQVRELSVEVLSSIQSELVQNPERGDIVKGARGVRKARVLTQVRHEERAAAIVIYTSTWNMPAEFTCFIYSAKVSKPIYRQIKRA